MNTIAQPFAWLLMFLYNLVNNYGLALLLVAIIVRVLLLPFQMKGKRGMMRQSRLQPKIAELQKKHGANKQKLNEEMAKLYKEEGVNPASGCLWSFIQMPIMIALFYAIRQPLTLMMGVAGDLFERIRDEAGEIIFEGRILQVLQGLNPPVEYTDEVLNGFYAQIYIAQDVSRNWEVFESLSPVIEKLQYISFELGILNLAEIPNWQFWTFPWDDFSKLLPIFLLFLLPLISGGAQFISAGIMRKMSPVGSPEAAKGTMGTVMKLMPLMSVWFGFILPAALSFYWTIGTVLQIGQDIWLTKKYTKILDEEDAEKAVIRKAKEAELEAKREETERLKAEGLAERNRNTSKSKKQKSSKQDKREKAAEWEKKNAPVVESEDKHEPSRVGNRRYARGRAYDPDRFSKSKRKKSDESVDIVDEDDEIDDEQAADSPYEYAETDVEYVDDSFDDDDDDSDEDDVDNYDEDDDDDEDDETEDDDDYDDDDDNDEIEEDDDEEDNLSSGKFETKRFD